MTYCSMLAGIELRLVHPADWLSRSHPFSEAGARDASFSADSHMCLQQSGWFSMFFGAPSSKPSLPVPAPPKGKTLNYLAIKTQNLSCNVAAKILAGLPSALALISPAVWIVFHPLKQPMKVIWQCMCTGAVAMMSDCIRFPMRH